MAKKSSLSAFFILFCMLFAHANSVEEECVHKMATNWLRINDDVIVNVGLVTDNHALALYICTFSGASECGVVTLPCSCGLDDAPMGADSAKSDCWCSSNAVPFGVQCNAPGGKYTLSDYRPTGVYFVIIDNAAVQRIFLRK